MGGRVCHRGRLMQRIRSASLRSVVRLRSFRDPGPASAGVVPPGEMIRGSREMGCQHDVKRRSQRLKALLTWLEQAVWVDGGRFQKQLAPPTWAAADGARVVGKAAGQTAS